jgi:hypothetical protein
MRLTRIFVRSALALFSFSSTSLVCSSANATSACDFLRGALRKLCLEAAQTSQEKPPQRTRIYNPPATTNVVTQSVEQNSRQLKYHSTTSVIPSRNIFTMNEFQGLLTWKQAFDKEVNDPSGFLVFKSGIRQTATGAGAAGYGLFTGQRNFYQKFLTDYKLYKGYYPSAVALRDRQNQCLMPRNYSPAEACDCVAGFPGDTVIGPGTGELVTESNSAIGIRACGLAAESTTNSFLKARFTAQRARAQVYTMDVHQAALWADEAVAQGYRRASIVRASAELRTLEILGSGFPGMRPDQIEQNQRDEAHALTVAKANKVWESFIVAEQYQEAMQRFSFNTSIFTSLFKFMTAPPPPQEHSCARDGVPCSGQGYDDHGNVINMN